MAERLLPPQVNIETEEKPQVTFVEAPQKVEKPSITHQQSIDSLWKIVRSRRLFSYQGDTYRIHWVQPGPGVADIGIMKNEATHFNVNLPTDRRYVAQTIASIFGWQMTKEKAPMGVAMHEVSVNPQQAREQVVYSTKTYEDMDREARDSVDTHALRIGES